MEGPGRNKQLPISLAMFDRVQQMRLARALVAKDRHDFGMSRWIRAIQIDHAKELIALTGKQFGYVVTTAYFIVRVPRKIIAKRIAGSAQDFDRFAGQF